MKSRHVAQLSRRSNTYNQVKQLEVFDSSPEWALCIYLHEDEIVSKIVTSLISEFTKRLLRAAKKGD